MIEIYKNGDMIKLKYEILVYYIHSKYNIWKNRKILETNVLQILIVVNNDLL